MIQQVRFWNILPLPEKLTRPNNKTSRPSLPSVTERTVVTPRSPAFRPRRLSSPSGVRVSEVPQIRGSFESQTLLWCSHQTVAELQSDAKGFTTRRTLAVSAYEPERARMAGFPS
jgi:hypothetical protein